MAIIDTHIHIWDFEKARYSWLEGDTTILNNSYHLDQLEESRKSVGITNGILVQAANNEQDTDWMLETAETFDWISGVVGWLPLMKPKEVEKKLMIRKANPYFKGVRHLIHNEADSQWLLQEPVLQSLQLLAENNITYDVVGVLPQHLEVAIEVSQKIPNLKLMLDHLNQPPFHHSASWQQWTSLMENAARHTNIYAKISGLGTSLGKPGWNMADLLPAIRVVLEYFGSERCCLGGDWPVSLLAETYTYTWQQYIAALTTLNGKESLENVFFTTAKKFYNL